MSKFSEMVYAIAKAINGPHYEDIPGDLEKRRTEHWLATTVQEKRMLLQRARAAAAQMESGRTKAIPLERPTTKENEDDDDM